jgi:hypothetical protein
MDELKHQPNMKYLENRKVIFTIFSPFTIRNITCSNVLGLKPTYMCNNISFNIFKHLVLLANF